MVIVHKPVRLLLTTSRIITASAWHIQLLQLSSGLFSLYRLFLGWLQLLLGLI